MLAAPDDRLVALQCLAVFEQAAGSIDAVQGVDEVGVAAAADDHFVVVGVQIEQLGVRHRKDFTVDQTLLVVARCLQGGAVEFECRFQDPAGSITRRKR